MKSLWLTKAVDGYFIGILIDFLSSLLPVEPRQLGEEIQWVSKHAEYVGVYVFMFEMPLNKRKRNKQGKEKNINTFKFICIKV